MLNNDSNHWLNFIGGDWVDSETRVEVRDPSTDEVFATIASATLDDAERAIAAARECVNEGRLTRQRPAQRAELLYRIGGEIRKLVEEGALLASRENGKSVNDARDEITEAARYFEYYAGMADKIEGKSIPLGEDYVDFTSYEPQGISVQIVPWNFPVSICARSLAPALAAGNAVIVKSPALPLTLLTPAPGIEGEWQIETEASGSRAFFVDEAGQLRGFVLAGDFASERQQWLDRCGQPLERSVA